MRDQVVFHVNGRRQIVNGSDTFLTLARYLRERLWLTGTKIVCEEGDCGSCSVLVGRPRGQTLVYQTIDACIAFVFQLDATHVVTVEGLSRHEELSAVQDALVSHHGSQCGFCTPGFAVAMTGVLERCRRPTRDTWRRELTGNLCRCTGYLPILDAGDRCARSDYAALEQFYPSGTLPDEFRRLSDEPLTVRCGNRLLFSPATLEQAVRFLAQHPTAKVVAGATDVGVQVNKGTIEPSALLDLNRLRGLDEHRFEAGELVCGALTRWTDLEAAFRDRVPSMAEIISIFGAPQIRNAGTIGGNIVNASPIADSLPFLMVTHAQLELTSAEGTRTVDINDFYLGYRRTDLRPGELLTRIRIPLPTGVQDVELFKVSRRRDLDIATFTAALLMETDGPTITDFRIALGAVAPTVIRTPRTEAFLRGRTFDEATMRAAGEMAVAEIAPISDVRGSADFRSRLTRNVFLKFYHQRGRAVA